MSVVPGCSSARWSRVASSADFFPKYLAGDYVVGDGEDTNSQQGEGGGLRVTSHTARKQEIANASELVLNACKYCSFVIATYEKPRLYKKLHTGVG